MNTPGFDFQLLDAGGLPCGTVVRVNTDTGLILQCHHKCEPEQVRRLAAIARETPDYPVDITAWDGPEGDRRMIWSARIYWRGPKIGGR